MVRRFVVVAVLVGLLGAIAGIAAAVPIDSFPQRVTQGEHDVTSGRDISIDSRSTVYSGSSVAGADVIVRNDGGTDLTINVTVRLVTHEGTVVASAAADNIVLTGTSQTFEIRFASAVDPSTYDRVEVEAVVA